MTCAAVREFTGIHHMIRGLLRLMDASVAKVEPGNAKQTKVLCSFGRFSVAGTHFHHRAEDDYYWPAIEKNGADRALLEPLMTEHKAIDPLLDETERTFEALKIRPIDRDGIASLRGLVDRFRSDMLRHLDDEEPVFFPLLEKYMPDEQSAQLAAVLAKKAPRQGLSWLMGGVEYGMTREESAEFLATFPKPIQWMRPLMLRKYAKDCGVLGVDPALPSQR
jgi:hemerythrin-like domain-containing protein